MKHFRISLTLAVLLTVLFGCEEKKETKVLTKEISFTREGVLSIKKAENDSVVARLNIEIADDEYQIQTGLMYRTSMAENQAMFFIFPDEAIRSFYMKNTDIPLDIIFINSEGKIVNIQKNTRPLDETSIPSEAPTKYVLEVNAGLSDRWGITKGDAVAWETASETGN